MAGHRESTTLRRRHDELADEADARRGTLTECTPTITAVTFTETTYPTSASAYYACRPIDVAGTEAEGQSVSTTTDSSQKFYAANIGSAIPPTGTKVILELVGGRWVFRHD